MKKGLILFLLLLSAVATYAYDFESNGIYYNITSDDDKTVEVTCLERYNGDYVGNITIPEKVISSGVEYTVNSIGGWAFSSCSLLTNVDIPLTVTTIGDCAFHFASLTNIKIPASVVSIGNNAFNGCSSLTNIELPLSLTSIGYCAFQSCSSLKSIEIPSTVTSLGWAAFSCCFGLECVELPSTLTSIGYATFQYCRSLKNIRIPSAVTSIGSNAFDGCSSLVSIDIPASVSLIGENAFANCSSLQEISVSNANENYTSVDGVLYDKNKSTLIHCSVGKSGAFTVPSSVTAICGYAFAYCTDLECIELPASLTSIGEWAFYECTSLSSMVLPSSVTSIGDYVFCWCSRLRSLTSFNHEPPTLGTSVFSHCPIETVYVLTEAVEAYQAADGWKEFNIVGIDMSGIEDAIFGGDVFGGEAVESATVYTLQGVRVKGVSTMDDVKSLTPGLYIVNGKKVFVK
jgi:hypothetical protein